MKVVSSFDRVLDYSVYTIFLGDLELYMFYLYILLKVFITIIIYKNK